MARLADPKARRRLVLAARAEFVRRGVTEARVEDITRRAGLAKGSFYLHFRSKDALFRELLRQLFALLEVQVERRQSAQDQFLVRYGSLTNADVAGGSSRFWQALEMEWKADTELFEIFWQHREVLRILESSGASTYSRLVDSFRDRMRDMVLGNAIATQAAGSLRSDLVPEVVADMLVGAYEAVIRRVCRRKKKPDLAVWARTLLVVTYEGLLARRSTVASETKKEDGPCPC